MFVILVYDAGAKRDPKILKICRKYLTWVQNSVFEGELSEAKVKMLRKELERVIHPADDYIIFYLWRSQRYSDRISLGTPKSEENDIW